VIFTAERDGPPHLFYKDLETGTEKELLPPKQRLQIPTDVSPDGVVAFERTSERGDADLWTVPVDGSRRHRHSAARGARRYLIGSMKSVRT